MTLPTFGPLVLHTERLTLRRLVPADAEALFDVHSDAQVMRYWSTPPWSDLERARQSIESDMQPDHLRLAIERTDRAGLIGTCSLFDFHVPSRRAELGYALALAHWGRGYMHEALTAFVEHAFTTLSLNRLEADIDPRNDGSRKSLERLGFKKEGHLRERWIVDGEVSDSGLYGLLRADWKAA
ncbi:GNAT family N-acetyltransferase [Piscinibacter sp.]|uniref:GNAT family N-acetyltransferase n=1 Tax=Piscinibacter sp. TaxID=1903157 RepID=UPI002B87E928|nr:GNAT family N-acetyltransferase [Albitalea sp.]HUG24063.1 GNAT family N-acetyltransferase [Albitalea sp.]